VSGGRGYGTGVFVRHGWLQGACGPRSNKVFAPPDSPPVSTSPTCPPWCCQVRGLKGCTRLGGGWPRRRKPLIWPQCTCAPLLLLLLLLLLPRDPVRSVVRCPGTKQHCAHQQQPGCCGAGVGCPSPQAAAGSEAGWRVHCDGGHASAISILCCGGRHRSSPRYTGGRVNGGARTAPRDALLSGS
jgi:hypothetical protein